MGFRKAWRAGVCVFASIGLLGCDFGAAPTESASRGRPANDPEVQRGYGGRNDQRSRQAALLNHLRSSDPQFRVIEKAIFNEKNELGIILDRSVEMSEVPKLMRSLLTQMARQFPGEDLMVVAYAPTQPPLPIGTGRLDARTREMTYTPAAQNNQ